MGKRQEQQKSCRKCGEIRDGKVCRSCGHEEKRGGPRGGGAPHKEKVEVPRAVTKDVAGDVLDSIDQMRYWRQLLWAPEDPATTSVYLKGLSAIERQQVERNLIYLTNRRHGKPAERHMVAGPGGGPVPMDVSVHERIFRKLFGGKVSETSAAAGKKAARKA